MVKTDPIQNNRNIANHVISSSNCKVPQPASATDLILYIRTRAVTASLHIHLIHFGIPGFEHLLSTSPEKEALPLLEQMLALVILNHSSILHLSPRQEKPTD